MEEKKYKAEYAKSGRASCKFCKISISNAELRIAIMIQSTKFDGKMTTWYHVDCFFQRAKPKQVNDIDQFDTLRWEDQEMLRKRIETTSTAPIIANAPAKGKSRGKKRLAAPSKNDLSDYTIQYAKSGRAKCKVCEENILKDSIRISKKDYESEGALMYGPHERWHHVECFLKARQELEFFSSGTQLPGFKDLDDEDKEMIKKKIPPINSDVTDGAPTPKKVKEEKREKDIDLEAMKSQNETMYKFRDELKILKKQELIELLNYNRCKVPEGTESMLDRLSDYMTFGCPKPCKVCKGQLNFKSGEGYMCTGHISEWAKCREIYEKPDRTTFKISKELKEKYSFLKLYKYKKIGERIFRKSTTSTSKPKNTKKALPLENMEFFLHKATDDVKSIVEDKFGGKIAKKFHNNISAVLTGLDTINDAKLPKALKTASDANVAVYSEKLLEQLSTSSSREDVINAFKKSKLSTFGDLNVSKNSDTVDGSKPKSVYPQKSKSMFKSQATTQKVTLKDGLIVDPDSGLADEAHVYRDGKNIYSVVLSLTDVQDKKNSYYKLQVLESDSYKFCWLYRSWGRIGTTIGDTKKEEYEMVDDAIEEFERLFEEKTGNPWHDRHNFKKVPGKMMMLELEQQNEDCVSDLMENDKKSKLAPAVQALITLIFNVEAMRKVMAEFELDLNKMPLGKITAKQIQKAYTILSDLQQLMESGSQESKIIEKTNQFYTLVPHDFGMNNPPLLDNKEIIRQKVEVLNTLMDIEIAYNLLDIKTSNESPIDAHYEKLKTNIDVVDKKSEEYKMIEKYVKNTHAKTHSNYKLEIVEVFKIEREGEYVRYKPYEKLPNKMLLWHGSRVTNFAGILSQGLRIAPPEAPSTGYMFGKGIYFADMVSKSANYCNTTRTNSTGLLLLCEVALGNMHELKHADYITKLPDGKHSVKGIGRTQPSTKEVATTPSGAIIPLGKGKEANVKNTALLYNEYIVYDVNQVNIKYLVQMRFKYISILNK